MAEAIEQASFLHVEPPDVTVLEAKLHPPAHHAEHISRPRLLDLLDGAASRPLTLVDAPAGFGKSILLAEWCARRADGCRYAWLSLFSVAIADLYVYLLATGTITDLRFF